MLLIVFWVVLLFLHSGSNLGVEIAQIEQIGLELMLVLFQINLFVAESAILSQAVDQFSGMHSVLLSAADYYVLKRTDSPLLLLRQEGVLELLLEYVEFRPSCYCLLRDFSEEIRKILHLGVVGKVEETVVQDRSIEKKGKVYVEPQSYQ